MQSLFDDAAAPGARMVHWLMSNDDERSTLIEALTRAEKANEAAGTSILGGPSSEYVAIADKAIGASPSFKAVTGKLLYSADSLAFLDVGILRTLLSYETPRSVPDAVDWLLKVLRTKTADGFLVAAIWGLSLKAPLELSSTERLVPFEQLRNSHLKRRIVERAERYKAHAPWLWPSYWQTPTAAYVCDIKDVQYIGSGRAAVDAVDASMEKAKSLWTLVEIFGAGRPLVFGRWFEYVDESLDISNFENTISFHHPEVAPAVNEVIDVDSIALKDQLNAFQTLPEDFRERLLRAAARFSLSQCRRESMDRALDLALAYEIILGGPNETNAGISWKLSVRAAQMMGGSVANRIATRKQVNDFYALRSRATHGGVLDVPKEKVEQATDLFRRLFIRLVNLGREPNWREIELEPVQDTGV